MFIPGAAAGDGAAAGAGVGAGVAFDDPVPSKFIGFPIRTPTSLPFLTISSSKITKSCLEIHNKNIKLGDL